MVVELKVRLWPTKSQQIRMLTFMIEEDLEEQWRKSGRMQQKKVSIYKIELSLLAKRTENGMPRWWKV